MKRDDPVGAVVVHSADTSQYANAGCCDPVGTWTPSAVVGRSRRQFVCNPSGERLAEQSDPRVSAATLRVSTDTGPTRGRSEPRRPER